MPRRRPTQDIRPLPIPDESAFLENLVYNQAHMAAMRQEIMARQRAVEQDERYHRNRRGTEGGVHRFNIGIDRSHRGDETVVSIHHDGGQITNTALRRNDMRDNGAALETQVRIMAQEHSRLYAESLFERIHEEMRRSFGFAPGLLERTREQVRHAIDLGAGAVNTLGNRLPDKPDVTEAIPATAMYPAEIVGGGFTAKIMGDTKRLWQESEDMRHCIYKTYTPAIQKGTYAAYHIEAKTGMGLARSGYTLGFRRNGYGNSWTKDQIKGKGNSIPHDQRLSAFCDHVLNTLNAATAPMGAQGAGESPAAEVGRRSPDHADIISLAIAARDPRILPPVRVRPFGDDEWIVPGGNTAPCYISPPATIMPNVMPRMDDPMTPVCYLGQALDMIFMEESAPCQAFARPMVENGRRAGTKNAIKNTMAIMRRMKS